MLRRVDHEAMPVWGIVMPWSFAAGGVARAHLSGSGPVTAARVVHLDRDGLPAMDWPVRTLAEVENGSLSQGSFLSLDLPPEARRDFRLDFEFLLTRNPDPRPLVDLGGTVLEVADTRAPLLDGTPVNAPAGAPAEAAPLPVETWLSASLSLTSGRLSVKISAPDGASLFAAEAPRPGPVTALSIGGDLGEARPTLNGRIGRIGLTAGETRAEWWFPTRGPVPELAPATGSAPPLHIRNLPTFAVTSARWDGISFDPRLVPDHYDAVHLHEDDLGPLDWPATHEIAVPEDAQSGVYALEIEAAGGVRERLPFFVRPRAPSAKLAVLLPTATYLAYADENLPQEMFPWVGNDRGHLFAQGNGLKSVYDVHSDGTGVSLTDLRRPRATVRDDYLYPLSGGPHLLPVDLHLLRFCAAAGIALDILTDHDLDAEGADALAPYDGLATGSHPEYWSTKMLDALDGFLGRGGNLVYLGGNGFDTVVAFDRTIMELRRGESPSHRTWDMRPGELHLSMTNEPGGPWRRRGRGEYAVTGVGISLMGFGPSRPFRRTEASRDPDCAFVFAGVEDMEFGHSGIVGGGAAGYEVDCTNRRLGTPPGTRVLAVADGFDENDFVDDAGRWFEGGETERRAHRRAEMTLRRHPGGGFVFAASSVAWCGALPAAGDSNAVGRITANVLRRAGGT